MTDDINSLKTISSAARSPKSHMIFFFWSECRREKREKEKKKAIESLGRAKAISRNSSWRLEGGRKKGVSIKKAIPLYSL
jgi:hypothetical protein